MAYQFARTSTYSRKGTSKTRSISDVVAELSRADGACPHVAEPRAPVVLAGMDPADIPGEIDRRAKDQRRALRGQIGRGGGIRRDQHIVEGAVYSHPHTVSDIENDGDAANEYREWRDDTIAWARHEMTERGLDVLCVVEHLDEAHPHIHVVAMPRADVSPRLDARDTHPGAVAKRQAEKDGELKPDQHFRAAMRGWQDKYYRDVGAQHGLARIGPKRRRLTRAEWQAEKAQARAIADAHRTAQAAREDAEVRFDDAIIKSETIVDQAYAHAQTHTDDASARAAAIIDQAEAEARDKIADADAQAQHAADLETQARETLAAADAQARQAQQREQQAVTVEAEVLAVAHAIDAFARGRVVDAVEYRGQQRWQFAHEVPEPERYDFARRVKPGAHRAWEWVRSAAQSLRERWEALWVREEAVEQREAAVEAREQEIQEIDDLEPLIEQAREMRRDAKAAPRRPGM